MSFFRNKQSFVGRTISLYNFSVEKKLIFNTKVSGKMFDTPSNIFDQNFFNVLAISRVTIFNLLLLNFVLLKLKPSKSCFHYRYSNKNFKRGLLFKGSIACWSTIYNKKGDDSVEAECSVLFNRDQFSN